MAETASGIDMMRRRIERASRQPPPGPRGRPPAPEEATEAAAPAPEPAGEGAPPRPRPGPESASRTRRSQTAAAPTRPRLAADLPPVNLAIRVRRPLDDHLAEVIHQLRRDGVRTSKVELIEMLLWEQTDADLTVVRGRLAAFRAAAPRGAGAPLEGP